MNKNNRWSWEKEEFPETADGIWELEGWLVYWNIASCHWEVLSTEYVDELEENAFFDLKDALKAVEERIASYEEE